MQGKKERTSNTHQDNVGTLGLDLVVGASTGCRGDGGKEGDGERRKDSETREHVDSILRC